MEEFLYKCNDCGMIFSESDTCKVCSDCNSKNITNDINDEEYNNYLSNMNKENKLELIGDLFIGNDNELYIKNDNSYYSLVEEISDKLNICNNLGDKARVKIVISVLD
jgi:DNA-directed RNA polymerase subunit RPC12/RpoP